MSLLGLFQRKIRKIADNGNLLEVLDNGKELTFTFNGVIYSKISKRAVFTRQYWDYFLPAAYVFKNPRILLIGMGAGTIPYQLQKLIGSAASITAVEQSEKIAELSKTFLPEPLLARVVIGDGATYIKQLGTGSQDIVMLDAYINNYIPEQFLSPGFVGEVHRVLSADGLFMVNFAMTFMGALTYAKYVALLKTRFRVYRIATALTEGNVIILCSKSMDKQAIISKIKEAMPSNQDTLPLIRNYENMKEE
ncbi:MAG: spermidine synthase [Candidatus Micrarchaeia archaeon]